MTQLFDPAPMKLWSFVLALAAVPLVAVGVSLLQLGPVGQAVLTLVTMAAVTGAVWLGSRSATARALGLRGGHHSLPVAAAVCVATALLTTLVGTVAGWLSQDVAASTDKVLTDLGLGSGLGMDLLLLATVGVLAPLGEELQYRALMLGGLFTVLRRWLGPALALGVALVVSSVDFGLAHGGAGQEPPVIAALIGMGLIYGLSYVLTGALWVPVLAHSLNNTLELGLYLWATPGHEMLRVPVLLLPAVTLALYALWRGLTPSARG